MFRQIITFTFIAIGAVWAQPISEDLEAYDVSFDFSEWARDKIRNFSELCSVTFENYWELDKNSRRLAKNKLDFLKNELRIQLDESSKFGVEEYERVQRKLQNIYSNEKDKIEEELDEFRQKIERIWKENQKKEANTCK
ncbi:hypothetical protein QAD02_022699 [Eretmocerus hayati]|uniref:Uncharacterized protein n=1 Tax=Eretmocerus hayati TaxID=131215 RepID=A0ACC2PTI6_9HYME|nr:hypothetical protein QAD02_022699 [Eretmocerus hayati]